MTRMVCLAKDYHRNLLCARIVKRYHDRGRQGLYVSNSIDHLQKVMQLAQRLGVPAETMGQFTGQVHTVGPDGETKKRKQKGAELDRIKAESQHIFATYGMMTEGIDIPRLDAGLDMIPRGKATQLLGRIRRPMPGKKTPFWTTIVDTSCKFSMGSFFARMKDYKKTKCEVTGYHGKHTGKPKIHAANQLWSH